MLKLKSSFMILPFIITFSLSAESSQTLTARKGLFHLLSADVLETSEYHFVTSVQYFRDPNLLEDANRSVIRGSKASLAFGYALTPHIHLSAHGGFHQVVRTPQQVDPSTDPGSESIDLAKGGVAATLAYDLGKFMKLPTNRFTGGVSIWLNLEKTVRILKAPDIQPTLILSGDFTDYQLFPWRTHLNLGFKLANGKRYFDSSDTVTDLDRFATQTATSPALVAAWGFELPFGPVTPSAEVHLHKVLDASFMKSPKWVTLGLKGRPFPQKNIELIGAVDVGLTSFDATTTGTPVVGPVPLWNAIVGFQISQFGRRAGEVGVNRREYEAVRQSLAERETMIAGLRRDLEFNTIQGLVIDAETKKPMAGVEISLPESSEFKASQTDEKGQFVRYFRSLPGARLVFRKEGFESSSKFVSLKPGERLTVDIEMKKAKGENLADFVASITDEAGIPQAATVTLTNTSTTEVVIGTVDQSGQLAMKVPEGEYMIEISASGFQQKREQTVFTRGKTLIKTFTLSR
jgi:hypothetical protein